MDTTDTTTSGEVIVTLNGSPLSSYRWGNQDDATLRNLTEAMIYAARRATGIINSIDRNAQADVVEVYEQIVSSGGYVEFIEQIEVEVNIFN